MIFLMKGGAQQISEKLSENIGHENVLMSTAVERIVQDDDGIG